MLCEVMEGIQTNLLYSYSCKKPCCIFGNSISQSVAVGTYVLFLLKNAIEFIERKKSLLNTKLALGRLKMYSILLQPDNITKGNLFFSSANILGMFD